jgi:hypothetical protein
MKALTFTTPVTAGTRNAAGEMVLRTLGDVTVTLQGLTRAELTEWEWATDALNTRGWDEKQFRWTVEGWKVLHGGKVVGMLFRGAGTKIHVEWYDEVNEDFFSAAWVSRLAHGTAAIINARQHAGQGLPVDVKPEPVKAPAPAEPVRPVWHRDGTQVTYHGSLEQFVGGRFMVMECECYECDRYQLMQVTTTGGWVCVAVHVGLGSVTPVESAPNILDALAGKAA